MRAWWGFGVGAVLIAAAYAADVVVGNALEDARQTFSSASVAWLEPLTRLGVLAALLGLAWLVFRGPRSRIVGLAMVVVGGYLGLVPELSLMVLANTDIQLPPFAIELLSQSTGFVLWAATGVAVLGAIELLAPTSAEARSRTAPELPAAV
jgi:hypothetical protein